MRLEVLLDIVQVFTGKINLQLDPHWQVVGHLVRPPSRVAGVEFVRTGLTHERMIGVFLISSVDDIKEVKDTSAIWDDMRIRLATF